MKKRLEVKWFAKKQLQANDHKIGWHQMGTNELLCRMLDEQHECYSALSFNKPAVVATYLTGELRRYYRGVSSSVTGAAIHDNAHVISELVDVANFCMMMADNLNRGQRGEE